MLQSSVGIRGSYYIVSVAGSTTLDGVSSWEVGDWAIFDGSTWQRLNTADSERVKIEAIEALFVDEKEPTGHVDSTQSAISFNSSTRTFSISPVGSHFDIYIQGVKQSISSTLSVTIPNTTGSYFIFINNLGQLNYQATFTPSLLNSVAYTAYIYWNAAINQLVTFGEERHGITMDSATHGYLHTSRGTQLISGAAIGYTTNGSGASNADAQVSISDAQVRDEDILANIRHSSSPSANFEQVLSPVAKIPVYYRSGSAWVRDTATDYPLKQGSVRAQYNLNTNGSWSLVDASANGKFLVSYVFVSTDVNYPVFAILGQDQYASLSDAQARASWSNVSFGDLPAQELKLCHIVIYETSSAFSNAPKAAIRYVSDVRFGVDREVSAVSLNTAHSNLSGLANDDHPQYLLRSDWKIKQGIVSGVSFSGTPKKVSVAFSIAYPNSSYGITITGEDSRAWTIESKTVNGFTINSNANQTITGNVYWLAAPSGETV